MAEYVIQDTTLTTICDAIRDKTGETELIPLTDVSNEIDKVYDAGVDAGVELGKAIEQSTATSILDGTITEYYNDKVTMLRKRAFMGCATLITVDLPKAITIGGYSFYGCTMLENVNIPSVKEIGGFNESTFFQCSVLKRVDLHKCEKIHPLCFNQCYKVEAVIFRNDTVCIMSSGNAFSNYGSNFFIYVPDNLVEEYKVATNWVNYADKIKPLSELPEES